MCEMKFLMAALHLLRYISNLDLNPHFSESRRK